MAIIRIYFFTFLTTLMVSFLGAAALEDLYLYQFGKEISAEVKTFNYTHRCGGRKTKRTCHNYTVAHPDIGNLKFDFDNKISIGSNVTLTTDTQNLGFINVGNKELDEYSYGYLAVSAVLLILILLYGKVTWTLIRYGSAKTNIKGSPQFNLFLSTIIFLSFPAVIGFAFYIYIMIKDF